MKKILFKIPDKQNEKLFLESLSIECNIDKELVDILFKYFGKNIYFIFSMFAGNIIKFPTIEKIDEIGLIISLNFEIKKMLEYNMKFDNIINILSEKYSLSTNQVFKFYNDMVYRYNILTEMIEKK